MIKLQEAVKPKKRNCIGIVGAGALGARHLQAFARADRDFDIWVMDPSKDSLENAKKILAQTTSDRNHCVHYISFMSELPNVMDAVIVSTSSKVRCGVIEELVEDHKVMYLLLEKVLFQQACEYKKIESILIKHNIKTWVNCGRRMEELYKGLREELRQAQSIEICVDGSDWGLGCNAIHMIDIIAFLSGNENLFVSTDGLERNYIQSKRPGFLEIQGTLFGSVGKCRHFSLTSYPEKGTSFTISITSDILKCIITEATGEMLVARKKDNWEWKKEQYKMRYQSEKSQIAIQEMIDTGNSELTDYETSEYYHLKMIEPLSEYFTSCGIKDGSCPIT